MIGIPPFNGFLSKWFLGLGALQVNQPMCAVVLLISSLLNAVYYLPIVINAFFRPEEHDFSRVTEPFFDNAGTRCDSGNCHCLLLTLSPSMFCSNSLK